MGPYPNWLLSIEEEELWTQKETAGWLCEDIERKETCGERFQKSQACQHFGPGLSALRTVRN